MFESEVRKHLRLRGKVWWIDKRFGRGRIQKSLHTSDKLVALRRAAEFFRQLDNISTSKIRLSQLYDLFAKDRKGRAPRYLQQVKLALRLFQEVVGDLKIRDIRRKHVGDFRVAMLSRTRLRNNIVAPISGYAINGYNRMLRSAFEFAVERELIEQNPFKKFMKTQVLKRFAHGYSPASYHAFRKKALEVYGEDFARILDLYLLLGFRDEEGTSIIFGDINSDVGLLTLPADKTKKREERIIPLPARAMAIFRELEDGGHQRSIELHPSTISHRWILMRDGGRYNGKDVVGTEIQGRFHDLRKTTVTFLKKVGLNPDFIDMLIGHKRRGVSAENYTDYILALDVVRASLEKITDIFFPKVTIAEETVGRSALAASKDINVPELPKN